METINSILFYFFIKNPGPFLQYFMPLLAFSAALIIGSIAFAKFYKKKKKNDFAFKRLFKKVANRMLLMGFLFLILVLIRYENIPYFAMRLWLYLAFVLLAYLTYYYIRIYKTVYPIEKENAKTKHVSKKENKYTPNKKKRR